MNGLLKPLITNGLKEKYCPHYKNNISVRTMTIECNESPEHERFHLFVF